MVTTFTCRGDGACAYPDQCESKCLLNVCYECGKPETENAGGLNTYELDHDTIELCDECLRQREHDDAEVE